MTDQEFIAAQADEQITAGELTTQNSGYIADSARVGVLVEEVKCLMVTHARTYIEIGRRLIEIREKTQPGEWLRILAGLGFQQRAAYDYMAVASKIEGMPRLKDLAENSFSKVLTLIQSTTEEDLAAIANGQGELKLDDIESMSVRKLKDALRKRTLEVDAIVAEETKTLRAETEAAIRRAETAEAELKGDWKTAEQTAAEIRSSVGQLAMLAGSLSRNIDNLDGYAKSISIASLETSLSSASRVLQELWTQFQERKLADWEIVD